jgi:hypothetical protein
MDFGGKNLPNKMAGKLWVLSKSGGKKVQMFYLRCWKATSTERMVGVKSAR